MTACRWHHYLMGECPCCFPIYGNEMLLEKADVMKDFPANNYIGERSLEHNLSLIPQNYDLKINPLREEDRDVHF